MTSTEKSPLLSNHGNQDPEGSKRLISVVGPAQSEDDERSSMGDVEADAQRLEDKNKSLFSKFKEHSPGSNLSGVSGSSIGNNTAGGDSKRRKPFHYSSVPTYVTDDGRIEHPVDDKTAATFNRYRYYSRLAGSPSQSDNTLDIPDHVLPPFLLSVELPFKDKEGKQGSIITIFSIWNTMMGTSLLSMPWAIQQAGFAMGLVLLIGMAGLTLYTCYRVVQSVDKLESGGKLLEFSDVCRVYLGRWGEFSAIFFSLSALLGAMIVYWVLMSNFMYSSVSFIYGHVAGIPDAENASTLICAVHKNSTDQLYENINMTDLTDGTETMFARVWSKTHTVPLFLCILILPLVNFKSPTFFTKFNALGTLSVMFLLVFVCVQAVQFGGFHLDFQNQESVHYSTLYSVHFPAFSGMLSLGFFIHNAISSILRGQREPENNLIMTISFSCMSTILIVLYLLYAGIRPITIRASAKPASLVAVIVVNVRFPTLSGILALGYFIHMCISSILRTQIHPEHNGRDMTIAYVLVAATYTFVGVMFYSTFPLQKDCLGDNLLDNFSHGNVLAFTARLFLLFQMVTLFPLLVFIFRIQCLDPLFGHAYPSWKHVLGLNIILMTVPVLFAVFLPQIGTIIRFSGAFCGLAYVFTLPCVVYMLELKQQNKLTWPIIVIHSCIIGLGVANFAAQFVLLAI